MRTIRVSNMGRVARNVATRGNIVDAGGMRMACQSHVRMAPNLAAHRSGSDAALRAHDPPPQWEMDHRIDVEIDNSSIWGTKSRRIDVEIRSIDVIDVISTKHFSLGSGGQSGVNSPVNWRSLVHKRRKLLWTSGAFHRSYARALAFSCLAAMLVCSSVQSLMQKRGFRIFIEIWKPRFPIRPCTEKYTNKAAKQLNASARA